MASLSFLFQLEQSQWWSQDRLRQGQETQLRQLLAHADAQVPFWRGKLRALIDAADSAAFWTRWHAQPLLTRRQIQDAGDKLISAAMPEGHGDLAEIFTSGSTGKPIRAVRSEMWEVLWSAFTVREHLWHRRDLGAKLAAIRTSTKGKALWPDGERLEHWGFSTGDIFKTGPCVSLNITTPIERQLEWLEREAPDYLLTHPTMLDRLLRAGGDFRPKRLKQVLTISEILAPGLRALCRERWGVTVIDTYSTRECGYLAFQCPEHEHYHLQAESALVEILDESGAPTRPGAIGRVVVTPLHNLAMPLLRYDIGDYAETGNGPCPCGRGLPVIKSILGRRQNLLRLPDGSERWPLLSSGDIGGLLALAPIRHYQVAQVATDRIELRLQTARALADIEVTQVLGWARKKFGAEFHIDLAFPPKLERSAAGKFEDFVSLL
ncbi:MAG: phenylacetate--CoA ligase family protein [Alphaproteobacteria bacterium]|nr:phenylacetate--CoA ligase family protein [Alphaproteobacteria bacterium]